MIREGSAQWQHYIIIAASIFLLYQSWQGWRLGVVRGLLRFVALFCAWIGGSMVAGATGTCIAFFSKVPPLIAPAVAGLSVGLGVYLGISFLSGLLFKKTEHHSGVVRIAFGLGGVVCGVIFGLLLLWSGITLIRGLGTVAEVRLILARSQGIPVTAEKTTRFFIKLKASLELGVTGSSLKQADFLPTVFYDNIVKVSMVLGDPHALERFIQYPQTQKLLNNPKVAAILQDSAWDKGLESHNILPLLQNPHFQEVAHDRELLAELKAFNLTGALNYALQAEVHLPPEKSRRTTSPNSPPGSARGRTIPTKPLPTPSAAN